MEGHFFLLSPICFEEANGCSATGTLNRITKENIDDLQRWKKNEELFKIIFMIFLMSDNKFSNLVVNYNMSKKDS